MPALSGQYVNLNKELMTLKVAIVRGSNMTPFEMQSYSPLASRYDITGYASFMDNYELDDIVFPIKKLHAIEEYYGRLPWPVNSLIYGAILHTGKIYSMRGLEKELDDKDILHAAETFNGYSYQAARVRSGDKKKKLVLTIWENIPFASVRTFKGMSSNKRVVDYVKDHADIFMAVTERAKIALMVEGVPEELIRVVPAGIDTDRFKPLPRDASFRSMFSLGDEDFVVMFMGRLIREKGVYDLLYAARLISMDPELKKVKIAVAGAGPERQNMELLANRLGIKERVRFIGGFPYKEVPCIYGMADVFILPSITTPLWQEQFGMVLVEAMASGLPVISTLSGSIPEVVGDGGILIQPNDPVSIYREIKKLALDEASVKKLGLIAREQAENRFNVNKISGQIEAVYKELL